MAEKKYRVRMGQFTWWCEAYQFEGGVIVMSDAYSADSSPVGDRFPVIAAMVFGPCYIDTGNNPAPVFD